MSQHFFERTIDGQLRHVQIGWDKPLQHFYCNIIGIDGPDGILYSNLFEFEKRSLDYYVDKCKDFGIELPEGLYEEVLTDQQNNVVNRVEWWD